jgi:hypothetical protein
MNLPDYQFERIDEKRVRIKFEPPVTKSTLGIPFSFLVLQQKATQVKATRFDRIFEIECEIDKWVSYLKTKGVAPERLEDFKDTVGYREPEPVPEESAAEEPATAAAAE